VTGTLARLTQSQTSVCDDEYLVRGSRTEGRKEDRQGCTHGMHIFQFHFLGVLRDQVVQFRVSEVARVAVLSLFHHVLDRLRRAVFLLCVMCECPLSPPVPFTPPCLPSPAQLVCSLECLNSGMPSLLAPPLLPWPPQSLAGACAPLALLSLLKCTWGCPWWRPTCKGGTR
jgi:hypothetical protein